MGFELPIDCDYPDHPKALKLIAKLGKRADIFPIRLWLWCAKFAKNGKLDSPAQVEEACRWDGKAGILHAAFMEAGIIDRDGLSVHQWMEHGGRKVEAYEAKKAADRGRRRSKVATDVAATSQLHRSDTDTTSPLDRTRSSERPFINERGNETTGNETKGETPPCDFSDEILDDLAHHAAFRAGEDTPRGRARWRPYVSSVLKSGVSPDVVRAEIYRKERDESEAPWDFRDRLAPKKQGDAKPKVLSKEEMDAL